MPPKFRFTKAEIIDAALQITRRDGFAAVTARNVAAQLNSSSKVIFNLFDNMEQLQEQILLAAQRVYDTFTDCVLKEELYPPYKSVGMSYIRFARQERELFRLLYMRDRSHEPFLLQGDSRAVSVLMENYALSVSQAQRLQLQMWIFVHGIATMLATDFFSLEEERISQMLTDNFEAMLRKYQEENQCQ